MVTDDVRSQPIAASTLLMAEVANEPQWIVWPGLEQEAAWAEDELARELRAAALVMHRRG
jgi:hypothetical protein